MRAYDGLASARLVAEPEKDPAAGRTPFQRDRARVLHSVALRRLAAKTQVVVAGEDDFPRTRLTHSLEVAQIGRELGAALGCDPDIVDAAGLAHDVGHPPFGHNGEEALDDLAASCGGFEGNAQTFRVLTRLEAKEADARGDSVGLNLTRATLDACCKYPWTRPAGGGKFGVYADDLPIFGWVRQPADQPRRRCLEAQVMDLADDVAYSVHDVEDGIHAGHIALARLADPDEVSALCRTAAAEYSDETIDDLAEVLGELRELPAIAAVIGYDGGHRAQRALKAMTSVLTGRLTGAALMGTRRRFGPEPLARYAADLEVPRRTRAECALLKSMALRWVMRRDGAERAYDRQRDLLTGLVRELTVRAPDALDDVFRPMWQNATDDAARLRVVIDQVASLTDVSVQRWARQRSDRGS